MAQALQQLLLATRGFYLLGIQEVAYAPDVAGSVLDASDLIPGWLENVKTVKDLSGNGHHLVQATAANQPLFLKHFDGNYCYRTVGSTSGDIHVSIPSSPGDANATLTGHTIEMCIKPSAWTAAGDRYLMVRSDAAGSFYSHTFYIQAAGNLAINLAAATLIASTAATGFSAKQKAWVRVEYIQNTGSGQYSVKFYTSTDGVTFNQLGTTLTGTSVANLPNTNIVQMSLMQGPLGVGPILESAIYSFKLWNQAGTLVTDWNAADINLAVSRTICPVRVGADSVIMGDVCVPVDRSLLLIRSNTILPVTTPIASQVTYKSGLVHAGRPPSATNAQFIMGMRFDFTGADPPPYTFFADVGNGEVTSNPAGYYAHAASLSSQLYRQRMVTNTDATTTWLIRRNGTDFTGTRVAFVNSGNWAYAYSTDIATGVAMGRMGLWINATLPANADIDTWLDAR